MTNELTMTKDEAVLHAFRKHARACSCHYADDSGKEWGLAREEKQKALELFDTHPHLESEMRAIMRKELWLGEFLDARSVEKPSSGSMEQE